MKLGNGTAILWARPLLAVLASTLLSLAAARGDSGKAVLTGAVLDPSGHCIAGATLTLVDSLTGVSRTVMSSKSGLYRIAGPARGHVPPEGQLIQALRRTPRMYSAR